MYRKSIDKSFIDKPVENIASTKSNRLLPMLVSKVFLRFVK
jgi:hypothetical protein